MIGFGTGIVVLKDNSCLLGKRKGPRGEGMYAWPGGALEDNETPGQCAERELWEETRLTIRSLDLLAVSVFAVNDEELVELTFLAAKWSGQVELREPHKVEDWQWWPLDDPPSPLYPGTAMGLRALANSYVYSEALP